MARKFYGEGAADVVAIVSTATGDPDYEKPQTTTTFTVWTARSGGTQHTSLLDASGNAASIVTMASDGTISFQGNDGYTGGYWLQPSSGGRKGPLWPHDGPDRLVAAEAAIAAGSSGAIPQTLVNAKGDIIAATANDVVTRVGIGSDGQRLTARSSATAGVAWENASAAALDDMTDVTIASPTDGQVVQYESATSQWKNKTFAVDLSAQATVADGLAQFPDVSDTTPTDGQIYVYDFTGGEFVPVDLDSVAAPLGADGRLATAVRPKYYRNIIVINEGDPLPADASVNDIVFSRPAAASITPILLGSQFNNGTNATSSAGLVITTTADAAVGTWLAISFMQSAEVSPALTDVSTTVGLSAGAVSGGFTLDAGSKVTIGATAQTGWLYGKVTTLIPSGSTITVKPTSTTRAEMSVTALAVPNLVSATPVDKQGTGSGNSVTAPANVASTATGTTTQAHEMALAVIGYNSGNPQTRTVAVQSGQGWTPATAQIVSTAFGGASHGMLTAYQELNAAGTASAKFTITDTAGAPATGQWCISVITLKAA